MYEEKMYEEISINELDGNFIFLTGSHLRSHLRSLGLICAHLLL